MTARGRSADARRAERVAELVHEVGNVLAAARLEIHLLPGGSDAARDDATAALERHVALAGELLALVGPILSEGRSRARVSVAEVLAGVAHVLQEPGELPGPLDVAPAPRGAPTLRVDLDALHHVLRVLVRTAFAGPASVVALRAGRRAGRVDFVIEADGEATGRGIARVVALADAALRASRGRVTRDATRRGARYRVSLPGAAGVRRS